MSSRQSWSKQGSKNHRRWLINIATLCTVLAALRVTTEAQQATKVPLVGILSGAGGRIESPEISDFREQLRKLGYIENHNIVVEYRYASGNRDRVPEIAAELAQRKVDVIVTSNTTMIRTVRQIAGAIPIVMVASSDHPTLIASSSQPGANVTGNFIPTEVPTKLLEILKEVYPRLSSVGVLWSPPAISGEKTRRMKSIENAARSMFLRVLSMPAIDVREFEGVFQAVPKERIDGLLVIKNPLFNAHRKKIVALAQTHRIPGIYMDRRYTLDGGLMSYGPDNRELWRQAASYVDKILRGAKPAELPVEQATKFELVINLKAARGIALTIPDSVLRWADEVIN